MKPEHSPYNSKHWPKRFRMRLISYNLKYLAQKEEVEFDLSALTSAIKGKEWDLLLGAVKLLKSEGNNSTESLKERAKDLADYLQDTGLDEDGSFVLGADELMTKSDILEYMRIMHPDLYDVIPKSPKGLTLWLKDAAPEAKQSRGYQSAKWKKFFEQLEKSASR